MREQLLRFRRTINPCKVNNLTWAYENKLFYKLIFYSILFHQRKHLLVSVVLSFGDHAGVMLC